MQGKYVVVRTYSAGVHCGTLVERNGKEVLLSSSRRIWRWKGANTLNEIACSGVGEGSRVAVAVPSVLLTEVIEVLECTNEGQQSLESVTWL